MCPGETTASAIPGTSNKLDQSAPRAENSRNFAVPPSVLPTKCEITRAQITIRKPTNHPYGINGEVSNRAEELRYFKVRTQKHIPSKNPIPVRTAAILTTPAAMLG